MKPYTIFIFLFTLLFFSINAQELDGSYKNQTDSLCFKNGEAVFSISDFGALSTKMVGEGNYELIENYLLIHTKEYSGEKTIFNPVEGENNDTITIQVTSLDNYPINGALSDFMNGPKKSVKRVVADENGKVFFEKTPKLMKRINRVKISHLGFNEIAFDLDVNSNYLVKLAKNNVIEHKTVVLKIEDQDEASLNIILLSDDFVAGKNLSKSLERVDRRAQKRHTLSKRYKKDYIPEFHGR